MITDPIIRKRHKYVNVNITILIFNWANGVLKMSGGYDLCNVVTG